MSENESKDRSQAKARARREKRRRETESRAPRTATRGAARVVSVATVAPAVSDREAVLAANAMFYRAFELRDADAMGDCWAKVPYARCIHPGWEPLLGWDEVVGSWRQIFRGMESLRFEIADLAVRVSGGLAWVELSENLEAMHEGTKGQSQVLATNLFERQPDGRWQMVHHHASPVMVRQPSPKRGGEPLH
jgi:ketosteroid isomerase-like protein